ncbi:hypothetical protein CYMTET_33104 [Cymbomonas tetramitiformis]|uniref:Uncharacterized protein n=1 Tax=Cymbomonas tetramitiformis TaxID=36881 RepID=A0AAE0FED1_9CHLO|nr:hypothetical protein CYMTET_33104 [Cymbomonas tetramitiformis]
MAQHEPASVAETAARGAAAAGSEGAQVENRLRLESAAAEGAVAGSEDAQVENQLKPESAVDGVLAGCYLESCWQCDSGWRETDWHLLMPEVQQRQPPPPPAGRRRRQAN